jgi:hypothetical protein
MQIHQVSFGINRFNEAILIAKGHMDLTHTAVRDSKAVDDYDLTIRVDDNHSYRVRLTLEEVERAATWFNQCLINNCGRSLSLIEEPHNVPNKTEEMR